MKREIVTYRLTEAEMEDVFNRLDKLGFSRDSFQIYNSIGSRCGEYGSFVDGWPLRQIKVEGETTLDAYLDGIYKELVKSPVSQE